MVFGSIVGAGASLPAGAGSATALRRKIFDTVTGSDKKNKVETKEDKSIPASVRRFLRSNGDTEITSFAVGRAPISSMLDMSLDLISFGGFSKGKEAQNVDKFFHTFIIVNNKWKLEKNQVVKISSYSKADNEEDKQLSAGGTIRELLMNGAGSDPSTYWGKYSSFHNNCQDWIIRTLNNNGIKGGDDFIKQPLDKLIPEVGQTTSDAADSLTDLAAGIDTGLQDLTDGLVALKKGGKVTMRAVRHMPSGQRK